MDDHECLIATIALGEWSVESGVCVCVGRMECRERESVCVYKFSGSQHKDLLGYYFLCSEN